MESITAVRVINSMMTKPGWTLQARPHPTNKQSIYLKITLDSVDSSDWQHNYAKPINQSVTHVWDVSSYGSAVELVETIIVMMVGYELHEWREFARIPDGAEYVAPFHPHTESGMLAKLMGDGIMGLERSITRATMRKGIRS